MPMTKAARATRLPTLAFMARLLSLLLRLRLRLLARGRGASEGDLRRTLGGREHERSVVDLRLQVPGHHSRVLGRGRYLLRRDDELEGQWLSVRDPDLVVDVGRPVRIVVALGVADVALSHEARGAEPMREVLARGHMQEVWRRELDPVARLHRIERGDGRARQVGLREVVLRGHVEGEGLAV